ncbi:Macrolide export protein MacA [Corynebacterium capitovis DSM 44611]|uniref:efflux RND transporter periplasmic adaptor subunit n=1 Tax=Corynebacterium capitovis TaxID=131081 RepID=UPI000372E104|nr:HlyD family efflux transporter periplasmic adaptor subunit [Corynebacterium capitovis]WKD57384.1 Macrolide export protein MacA [Corynebacterium capitovis DSM 44611]
MLFAPIIGTRTPKLKLAAGAIATAALLLSGCGLGGGSDTEGIGAGDYTIAAVDDVTDSTVVNGKVQPVRSVTISAPIQSKVENLAVAVGDRVEVDQLLAKMDTTALERELADQEKQQAADQAEAMNTVGAAQAQLAAYDQQVANGSDPTIAAAEAQVAQAQAAYNAVSTGAAVAPGAASDSHDETESYATQEAAYAALQQAQTQLATAQSQSAQTEKELRDQVDTAWAQAQTVSTLDSTGTLQLKVQEATIYAPIAGVVTSVNVQQGDVPSGAILTIADDSRLKVSAEVRESDVSKIATGNRVRFTSTATGKREYVGRLARIAPTPASKQSEQQASAATGSSNDATYPVEIDVEGEKDGLLLGGSVRAEIITQDAPDTLSVPLDAVVDSKVLVVAVDDGKNSGTIEEKSVETGASNDVDVAVTGGDLQAGDIVLNWPEEYRDKVGQTVSITDPNFDYSRVNDARASATR